MIERAPHGLLLAAGRGSRMGRPKALVVDERSGPWLLGALRALRAGGCDRITVVLGAAAEEARELVPPWVDVVVADDWEQGLSASLRAGLASLETSVADAVVVHLVDLPDVTGEVVRRVVLSGAEPGSLARAAYDRRPGHPVLLGRDHWHAVVDSVSGDRGARDYLAGAGPDLVECGDIASGEDVDEPAT